MCICDWISASMHVHNSKTHFSSSHDIANCTHIINKNNSGKMKIAQAAFVVACFCMRLVRYLQLIVNYYRDYQRQCINTENSQIVSIGTIFSSTYKCLGGLYSVNGSISSGQEDSWLWFISSLADEFSYGFSCFVWYADLKMAPMDTIWLFSVLMHCLRW